MFKPISYTSLATLLFFAPTVLADTAQMRQLVPDAGRTRAADRTYIFSRSQLKYGLEADSYLNRWVDRPLFVNPELKEEGDEGRITYPSFQRIQQTYIDYGLDGMAFFPETSGRSLAYEYTKRSGKDGFALLTEFTGTDGKPTKSEVLKMALDSPASLRFKGKVVITSYSADRKPVAYWTKTLADLKKQHGDSFFFLPSLSRFAGESASTWLDKFNANTVTAQDVANIKADLREWLRATDGIYFASISSVRDSDRRFNSEFYREFVIRIMRSVLAEPEFTGKYFGLQAQVGHENVTRFGYTFDSNATKTLRQSLVTAIEGEADIINIPEWDEQNENTSLRPTVYNGTSSERIMRYYMAAQRKTPLQPLAQDDTSVPNLILSYRKQLTLGEAVELELLNIPDTPQSAAYSVQLSLVDGSGKSVYESPRLTFDGKALEEHTLTVPSETFAAHRILSPRLQIITGNRNQQFGEGLHYIELRPTWNWDYKWVKTPLRDLLAAQEVSLQVSAPDANKTRTATARFATNEPLAYVELLDNDDVVYSASANDEWRENAEQIVLSIAWQSPHATSRALTVPGSITLQNATGRWLPFGGRNAPKLQGQTLSGIKSGVWQRRVLVAVPRNALAAASLQIDLPGIYQGNVKLQEIMDKTVFAIPGPNRFNLVVSHYVRQLAMPNHLKQQQVQFSVPVLPDLSNSVLHLQAIGVSGKTYRSQPVVLGEATAQTKKIEVYSNTRNAIVTADVAAATVPDIRYEFNPANGSALLTDAGRPFWGILGGYFTQVTERGGGETGDGTPFISDTGYPEKAVQSAPAWVKDETNADALQFDGIGTFLSLPQGVTPRRTGHTIEMDIKPESSTGKQIIIAHRSYYPGSLTVYTENGVLKADFLGEKKSASNLNSQLTLPAGQWSKLKIRCNQNQLIFEVDGKISRTLTVPGPGIYETATVVGGYGEHWFKGLIKSLRINHQF